MESISSCNKANTPGSKDPGVCCFRQGVLRNGQCPFPTLCVKNPPPYGGGFSNCSFQYAERRPSDPYNAGSHVFYSSFDKHHVGPFGSRHCRAGGFTRLPSSKMYQTRVCQRPLAAKNPPFPEKRGIFHTNCSFQYAERILATGRAVLLDCRQATSTSHEFGRRASRLRGCP